MKKQNSILIAVFCLFLILILLCNPAKYSQSCLNGFLIFGKKVLPALFPFLFLTKLIGETKIVEGASKKVEKITQKIWKTNGNSAYIFLMSTLCGYPLGAKLTSDFYENKILSQKEAQTVSSFTSTSGPIFIIGVVGIGMFSSFKIGLVIFISHILGAILNGIVFSKKTKKENTSDVFSLNSPSKNMLSDCMYNSIVSVLLVGGFIAFFTVIIDVFLSIPFLASSKISYVFSGLIEITRGCLDLSKSLISKKAICTLATFLISFGGVCIHTQSMAFLSKCKINYRTFLFQKVCHATISTIICIFISMLVF